MIPILSLVTSIKDYLEVVHKLIEYDSVNINYTELGTIIPFFLISLKNCVQDFFSFSWLIKENLWSLPIIIPEISSAMISEISVLDGYLHNAFNFLDTPISYGMPTQNSFIVCLEKLIIGLINSFFLFLPTSIAHIITLRRFVMQGLEAGYIAGLGAIAGNFFWLASVILGFRFFVIPWLSLDIFRYMLGFVLLVKYMWDSYNERKVALEDVSKRKIFLLNFLLALTEQTSIYPFISNLSISPEASILETFPSNFSSGTTGLIDNALSDSSGTFFILVHVAYLLGILIGSLSLLHLSCWFWENPAFKLYMWVISSFKVSTSVYYRVLNFTFLYLTMFAAVCSIPYYGLDYTITNPLGYVSDDRLIQDKVVLETSFLGTKASDRNTRRNRGRHGRRERWKRRIRKYRTFDASLYDQGIYDLFTIEDLNYGFDRFWLRRKLRNHRVRFRFFPGPWMRSFKKQLAKPRLESYTGPRIEFFRILFEQVYHPSFHGYNSNFLKNQDKSLNNSTSPVIVSPTLSASSFGDSEGERLLNKNALFKNKIDSSLFLKENQKFLTLASTKDKLSQSELLQKSTLRKFIRKVENRLNTSLVPISNTSQLISLSKLEGNFKNIDNSNIKVFQNPLNESSFLVSKNTSRNLGILGDKDKFFNKFSLNNFYLTTLTSNKQKKNVVTLDPLDEKQILANNISSQNLENNIQKSLKNQRKTLSRKDLQILYYRSLLTKPSFNKKQFPFSPSSSEENQKNPTGFSKEMTPERGLKLEQNKINDSLMLLHPLKFYLQQEAGFKRKFHYYSPSIYRKFSVENNAPYFRVMMKRYFYNYKPNLRWERTMKAASLRKARRKTTRIPKKLQKSDFYNSTSLDGLKESPANLENLSSSFSLEKQNGYNKETIYMPFEKLALQKPTSNYSVVSKKASRYRYQIYKDVLQHWYYSPFNRLLLKLDVDSFIRRQPKNHFLTVKEENLLHLRRFLLSEHYNTLRWYTNMEHYRTMKTQLNGATKSFSSRTYNQQFSGTFKKIRHLFAITPSIAFVSNLSSNMMDDFGGGNQNTTTKSGKENQGVLSNQLQANVLKFDQPLYNEYPTETFSKTMFTPLGLDQTDKQQNNTSSLFNPLVIHEELLPEILNTNKNENMVSSSPLEQQQNDLLSQSQNIVRQYLIETRSIRQEYIQKLINEKNYSELTQFIYKGQKLRGTEPTTNQKSLNNQEENYLLTSLEKNQIENEVKTNLPFIFDKSKTFSSNQGQQQGQQQDELYLTYLKNWKRRVNDQESLKTYLSRRFEKREKHKQKKEKQLLSKLNRLESWTTPEITTAINFEEAILPSTESKDKGASELLTTGLQKSILEGMFVLNNVDSKVISLNEKNVWKSLLLSKIKNKLSPSFETQQNSSAISLSSSTPFIRLQDLSLRFNDLKNVEKAKLSNEIKTSIQATRAFIKKHPNLKINKNKGLYTSLKNKITSFVNISFNSAKTGKKTLLGIFKFTNVLKSTNSKTLKNWRKKERVLGKQRRSRKEFKLLNTKSEKINTYLDRNELELALQIPSRKKRDNNQNNVSNTSSVLFQNEESQISLGEKEKQQQDNFASYAFKRKRSPQRRSRIRRNRGVFKKRTLTDLLRKDFSQLLNEKDSVSKAQYYKKIQENLLYTQFSQEEKVQQEKLADTQSGRLSRQELFGNNNKMPLKQRKAKQRKERIWKQKRSKYSQKRRKYRKRRRYTAVKIRNLNKQFKRIKNKIEIQNWWWKQFIPSIQASNEALWQIEKDKLIQQKLSQLSTPEILERDNLANSGYNMLQIGNKDFKPLALPQAIRIQQSNNIKTDNIKTDSTLNKDEPLLLSNINEMDNLLLNQTTPVKNVTLNSKDDQFSINNKASNFDDSFNVVNKLYESLFIKNNDTFDQTMKEDGSLQFNEFLLPNTNLPFYAGWDESLRKLIITNRMLSRKDAGFALSQSFIPSSNNQAQSSFSSLSEENLLNKDFKNLYNPEFTSAPLQGMNAATTLYWQIPFTTYDPDQFFALGMDGFSPIGWRKFLFRHSILKTWLADKEVKQLTPSSSCDSFGDNMIATVTSKTNCTLKTISAKEQHPALIVKNKGNVINDFSLFALKTGLFASSSSIQNKSQKKAFAISRRLKKRYRRVKKHPRTPVWFPSGPLLNQVLPVHYIYVFYKRARLPRDRYLKRRLLNVKMVKDKQFFKDTNPLNFINYDFTLRKRLKPKRKYHLKRDYYASNVVIPRRFKFMAINETETNVQKWRPLSSLKIHKPVAEVVKEQLLLRRSATLREQKQRASKQPNIRVKQLRRRVQRQILRSVWRYRPRAGGFVWPGDYLKLELVKAPKLYSSKQTKESSSLTNPNTNDLSVVALSNNRESTNKLKKQKRKKKRTLVEWQIQPKKYLYEKHNLKVLKKKLKKTQRLFEN